MYNKFFGFDENPFASKPDPAFFYRSKQHDASLTSLIFSIQARMGLTSLTGERGTGKTLVLECLRDSLESANIPYALLPNPRISVNHFFQSIASDLDLRCQGTSAYQVFSALHQFMIQQARRGRTMALIVDQAHDLPAEVFNEILHLVSLHDDKIKLLQAVLAGRPELHPALDALNLDRLQQRAILNCTLQPFTALETKEYIEFRLARAGMAKQTVFSPDAIAEIYDRSGGYAPAIHVLCGRLLLAAFSATSKVCTQEILDHVFKQPPGKQSSVLEIAPTAVSVIPVDLAVLAPPSEPEPPPLTTALLRLAFDAIPGLPPPLPVSGNELPDPERIALHVALPVWTGALPAARLAVGSIRPMRLVVGANVAASSTRPVHPNASWIPSPSIVARPVIAKPVICAGLRSEGRLQPIVRRRVIIPSRSAAIAASIDFPNRMLGALTGESRRVTVARIRESKLISLEGYVSPRPPLAYVPIDPLPCSANCAEPLQPNHRVAKLQLAGIVTGLRVPVPSFQVAKCDPPSPVTNGDVPIRPVNLENPIQPEIAKMLASREACIRERDHLLPLASSVPPSQPPARLPITSYSNVLPPLEAWCPPSRLEAVNPRSSFLLLSSPETASQSRKLASSHWSWLLTLAIPILAGVALYGARPAIEAAADAVHQGWLSAHQAVIDRAAVALNEDFRSGLDDWMSRGGARPSWTSDAAGFVHPAALALYRPSLGLIDYQMQFVGQIDKKGLSWVVRAADFNNYYAIRLTVLKPGPTPAIGVTRYAVINGKTQNQVTTPLLMSARSDTVYRVSLDVRGDHYALSVQDQPVDSWSEPKLRSGGIGFFSEPDAGSRIAGVHVWGQNDVLGRLCAFLAPSGVSSYRASLSERATISLTSRGDLYSSSPGHAGRLPRAPGRLDPAFWQVPEVTLPRTKHCPSPVNRVGVVRARHASPYAVLPSSGNCY